MIAFYHQPEQPYTSDSQNLELLDKKEFRGDSDELIWHCFRDGNEAAFIHIYHEYANVLYNYGCKFSINKALVEDCLQDFFLYIRKNRSRLGDTKSIKLYLLKAFRRRVIEYVTKQQNEKKKGLEIYSFNLDVEVSDEVKYINQQSGALEVQKLNNALLDLDEKEREAVYHFYYEGLSYKEIAEMLGFTHVSSARRLIYRALKNLRCLI